MRNLSAYNGNKPYIFISYSHKDSDVVMQMIDQMVGDGYRVWYDEGIRPGSEWDSFIAEKIENSGLFLAFISQNYLDSNNCKDEMNFARDHMDNTLLVYLSDVKLPAGMELRFGRTQAIPAFKYVNKGDFFNKLYSTSGIDYFRSSSAPSIVATNSPVRVDKQPQQKFDKKLAILAIAVVLVVIILVVIIIAFTGKSSDEASTDSTTRYTTSREVDNSNETENVVMTTASSDIAAITTISTQATIENVATTSATTETTTPTEATTDGTQSDEGYEYENIFSGYNLGDGYSYYDSTADSNFYNNTGAVYLGYLEGESYCEGVFYNTDTMSVRIPALNGYSEEVSINWFYINSNNEAVYLFGDNNVVPTLVNGEMSYTSTAVPSRCATGDFLVGTYYVTVNGPANGDDMIVTRFFYTQDTLG